MNGFIEVDYAQNWKHSERIAGDVFLLSRDKTEGRIVCTLSDGLGSGVKANVLANLTATMGQKFTTSRMDIVDSARVIMKTLPTCRERKISYSTFTMVDINSSGVAKIVEYDNPPYMLIRNGKVLKIEKTVIPLENRFPGRTEQLYYSEVNLQNEDRLIFFSDGVSQSGMGTAKLPLGWRTPFIEEFVTAEINKDRNISARDLSRKITSRALLNDIQKAKDDITCAVVYPRKPRKLLLVSGPPIDPENDQHLLEKYEAFTGKKIICGGTTAGIIAEGLNTEIETDLRERTADIPPLSRMEGADLVTEGILTLSKTAEMLETKDSWVAMQTNAVRRLICMLMNTDEVHFLVGTKINEAHQDPSIPVELGLRRTIIHRIKTILESKYLKQTFLEYI
ncbi:MAG: SpoIIE family protein phosphatase [Spirochaetales bacterium]|uniref:SpoIIE family protein phosphatase n=1 Tax=Candidatus Thalassospirochaeta sargassi TaxID=3119039 RepID=A0AAJ1MNK8_9SPIO|nr:SpoIIE family protein phosphatase [Spirochaetales bacterium]